MDVHHPRFGVVVVEGIEYNHDVVIDGGSVRPRDKDPSRPLSKGHTPLTSREDIPWSRPQLLIGTGHKGRLPVIDDVYQAALEHGVEVVALPTEEICRRLTTMAADDVSAVIHVTC